jgi:hypothetical protein
MNEKELYLLLVVIQNNGNVKRLTREGISYLKIAELTNEAIVNNLVIYNDDIITLSEKGLDLLNQLGKNYKKTNKEEWIEKDLKNKIQKLNKNIIFVPKQNDLFF